ncbi:MAG: type II secretion system F family protein [Vulcanimicrobiota bacterium]
MIESTLSIAHLGSLFDRIRSSISAQRYAILLGPDESGLYVFSHSSGFEEERIDLLDLEIIEKACLRRASCFNGEEALASVLCVPFLGTERQVVGLIYLEDRSSNRAFRYTEQLSVENLVKALHTAPAPVPAVAPRPVAKPASPRLPAIKLSGRDQVVFLVQLSTFVKAGISLMAGLQALVQSGGACGQLAGRMLDDLLKGRPLSYSLELNSNFPRFVLGQLRSAEHSGQLALSLELLAQNLESQRTRQLRLRGAVAYPAFLLVLCLGLSILAPSYLLKGQLEFYQAHHMEMPTLSLLLLQFGRLISNPLGWLLLGAGVLALGRALHTHRQRLIQLASRSPGLGTILRMEWECRVLSSLQMLLHSGVGILEAIPLAVDTSSSQRWQQGQKAILEALAGGETLSRALSASGLISRMTRVMLAAGEESGAVVDSLRWSSKMLEAEFESRLDFFAKLLEPLVMAIMGVIVGIMTIASLLPSVRFIQGM